MYSSVAAGENATDGGIVGNEIIVKEIKKNIVIMTISSLEYQILQEFNKTALRTRIVKIRVKRGKKKTKVYLTWHPQESKNIATDIFIIVKVITKMIPQFYSISLKAIHPKYMRWSGHITWDGVIIRSAIHAHHSC